VVSRGDRRRYGRSGCDSPAEPAARVQARSRLRARPELEPLPAAAARSARFATDGALAGATSAAVTGTSGAVASARSGRPLRRQAAGASAGAGAAASAGAGTTAGCACVVSDAAAAGDAPTTPPVTLIESSPESSFVAAGGADAGAGAGFAGVLPNRIGPPSPSRHRRLLVPTR